MLGIFAMVIILTSGGFRIRKREGPIIKVDQKPFKKGFRLNVRKFAFNNRVVNDWNILIVTLC